MSKAVYPGTFDPPTRGHIDVVQRASRIFDEVIVAVGTNPAKQPFFPIDERLEMVRLEMRSLPNVRVDRFDGLVIDYLRSVGPAVILRGLRNASDFEAEFRMAMTNRVAGGGVETLFIVTSPQFAFHASHLIREIALFRGDVSQFLTDSVRLRLEARLQGSRGRRARTTGRKGKEATP